MRATFELLNTLANVEAPNLEGLVCVLADMVDDILNRKCATEDEYTDEEFKLQTMGPIPYLVQAGCSITISK